MTLEQLLALGLILQGGIVLFNQYQLKKHWRAISLTVVQVADLMYLAGYKMEDGRLVAPEAVTNMHKGSKMGFLG